ncbi:hypothetical protein B0H14DRAFT_2591064 [Mycena olivaceomarginata]|nr:hypothetical protein B0H14DRAFT_2591064 [Mycena olivaceomarginata]
MPPPTVTQNRLDNVVICLTMTTNTLQIIADSMKTPSLGAIINTTQAVLKMIQLLEKIYELLNAIMILHIKSDAEAQQKGNRVKTFFRQGEISTLLKACQAGLQQSFEFFQIEGTRALPDIAEMKKDAQKRHQEVLDMIEKLSEATASERASTISGNYSWSSNRPFGTEACPKPHQSSTTVFHKQSTKSLDLDELETLWEPASSCANIEELLSLVTVQWTRPFLKILQPLDQEAAQRTFVDIADSGHSLEEVDQILFLADNMPLAISLLAHLADTEGCPNVLSCWDKEKTSVISEGFDKRSNLDLSISLSLLSLLSMLPDGLTDADLIQSKLPLENILKCKTALKSTALAYSDEHKD